MQRLRVFVVPPSATPAAEPADLKRPAVVGVRGRRARGGHHGAWEVVRVIDESVMHPPSQYMPQPCQRARCVYRVLKHADGGVDFVHDGPKGRDTYRIANGQMDDVTVNLWGDHVKPWIERLHEEQDG
jgi:hypothetical protein